MAVITWNPSDKSNDVVLTNGNLTATRPSYVNGVYYGGTKATEGVSDKKVYFECLITGNNYVSAGVSKSTTALNIGTPSLAAAEPKSQYWYTGVLFSGNYSYASAVPINGILGVALDLINGKLFFSVNGVWQSSSDPATGVNPAQTGLTGEWVASCYLYYTPTNNTVTANFGDTPFTYPIPEGYTAYGVTAPPWYENRIKTKFQDMNIGDVISCNYNFTAGQVGSFSNLGSAVPTGKFYFIHSGKDNQGRTMFIANKNLQTNISFNTLDTAGLITEGSLVFTNKALNGTNDLTDISFTARDSFSNTPPKGAFNGILADGTGGWISNIINIDNWLQVYFPTPQKINIISILGGGEEINPERNPKDCILQGSVDGVSYFDLKTFTCNLTLDWQVFNIDNDTTYNYYRLFIKNNYGDARIQIREMQMGEKSSMPFVADGVSTLDSAIQLLSGGVTSVDKINTWDTVIDESTLEGIITAGDNNVWSWNNISSWTSGGTITTLRVNRGGSAVNTRAETDPTTTNSTIGFRPIVLIGSITKKHLIRVNSDIKKYQNGWVTVGTVITQEMFITHGMDTISYITETQWAELGTEYEILILNKSTTAPVLNITTEDRYPLLVLNEPEILTWTDNVIEERSLELTFDPTRIIDQITKETELLTYIYDPNKMEVQLEAQPTSQFIKAIGDISTANIESIENISVIGNEATGILISFDSGLTWRSFYNGNWVTVNINDIEQVKTQIMSIDTLNRVSADTIENLRGNSEVIRFAYLINNNEIVNTLVLKINLSGYWQTAVPQVDYKYGYVNLRGLEIQLFTNGNYKVQWN